MTPEEIQLIRRTYARLVPIADQAAALFHARLFELDPSLRTLFHGEMAAQGRQLMQAVGFCVAHLDRLTVVVPMVRNLGLRRSDHHVRAADYETVGAALLWALGKALGPEFTPAVGAAWSKLYWLLAETMKAGARDGAAQQERVA